MNILTFESITITQRLDGRRVTTKKNEIWRKEAEILLMGFGGAPKLKYFKTLL